MTRFPGIWTKVFSLSAAASVVLLVGCSLIPGGNQGQGGNSDPAQSAPPSPVTPEIVDDNGYWRANTLPAPVASQVVSMLTEEGTASARFEILSLDTDGTSVRLIGAWLPPTQGVALDRNELTVIGGNVVNKPWVRLADPQGQQIIEAYQRPNVNDWTDAPVGDIEELEPTETRGRYSGCMCSYLPADAPDNGAAPEETSLFFVDFPKPAGDTATILAGENIPAIDSVPISQNQKFEIPELAKMALGASGIAFPENNYGGGASGQRKIPLTLLTESVTEASVSRRGQTSSLNVQSEILFDFDKDTLNSAAEKTLDSVADELKKSAAGQEVTVEGHTDDEGSDSYNQDLSERRAQVVQKALEPKLSGSNITLKTQGFGETQPIVPNRDADNKPIKKNQDKNRRVSFSYEPVAEVNGNIDTGKEVKDLPVMENADANDSLASGILPTHDATENPDVKFDVKSVEEQGEYLKLKFAISSANGQDQENVFDAFGSGDRAAGFQFGHNTTASYQSAPTGANLKLWDKESGMMASTITAAGVDCLCSRNKGLGSASTSFAEPTEMFAYFPKSGINSGTLTLRVADTAQIEFNRN